MRIKPSKDCSQLGLINAVKVIVELLAHSKTLQKSFCAF